MTAQFCMQRRVEFADTDTAGILHFASYYRYMEEAEHAFFRSLGLSVMQKQADGSVIGWPRVSASCTYEAPAHFEDVLEIHLNVSRKGVKSLTMEFEFRYDGARIARGRMKTACCLWQPGESFESIRIPPPFDERIQEATLRTE